MQPKYKPFKIKHMNSYANDVLASTFSGLKLSDVSNTERVAELLDKFGLRWSVSKQPLVLPDGAPTPFYAVVRDDNKEVFSTCKDAYVPYQNSELAELLIRISEKTGYSVHSGGEFNKGGKVYIQINSGNQITGIGENRTTVKGYITGINGHDGTTSLKWGAVNFTICCRNTFASAKSKLQNSARHTSSIHDRVERSIREIESVTIQERAIFEQFIKLSEIPVTRQNIAKIVKDVTSVDIDMPRSRAQELFSGYQINRAGELTDSIASEMKTKGETLWGLFSGVTHYTSHKMPVPTRENGRIESKYVGNGATIDNDAFASILHMAK
jgi:phage/plasmid-like protein (TIGR03299 family)